MRSRELSSFLCKKKACGVWFDSHCRKHRKARSPTKTTPKQNTIMETTTTAHATLEQFIQQMRLLGKRNNQAVKIQYNSEQAVASFYLKGKLVDTRRLFRL